MEVEGLASVAVETKTLGGGRRAAGESMGGIMEETTEGGGMRGGAMMTGGCLETEIVLTEEEEVEIGTGTGMVAGDRMSLSG